VLIWQLVLIIGDLHIPHRAAAIPQKFQSMLVRQHHTRFLGWLTFRATHLASAVDQPLPRASPVLTLIPEQTPGKIKRILSTGNLCTREQLDYFKQVCSDVTVVKGDFDEASHAPSEPRCPSQSLRAQLCGSPNVRAATAVRL